MKLQRSHVLNVAPVIALVLIITSVVYASVQNPGDMSPENMQINLQSSPAPQSDDQDLSQTFLHSSGSLSLKYPPGWNVMEDSEGAIRRVTITAPNQLMMQATLGSSGVEGRCDNDPNALMGTDTVSVMGQQLTVFFVGSKENDTVSLAYLLNDDQPCNNIPYMNLPSFPGQPKSLVRIEIFPSDRQAVSAEAFRSDEYQTMKHILQSVQIRL